MEKRIEKRNEVIVLSDRFYNPTTRRRVEKVLNSSFSNCDVIAGEQPGTTIVRWHDESHNPKVQYLEKRATYFCSFNELIGWSVHKGFSHISINDGDGWTSRLPIVDVARGYIPRYWAEMKYRFYRSTSCHWRESMTIYPGAYNIFYQVKEV